MQRNVTRIKESDALQPTHTCSGDNLPPSHRRGLAPRTPPKWDYIQYRSTEHASSPDTLAARLSSCGCSGERRRENTEVPSPSAGASRRQFRSIHHIGHSRNEERRVFPVEGRQGSSKRTQLVLWSFLPTLPPPPGAGAPPQGGAGDTSNSRLAPGFAMLHPECKRPSPGSLALRLDPCVFQVVIHPGRWSLRP